MTSRGAMPSANPLAGSCLGRLGPICAPDEWGAVVKDNYENCGSIPKVAQFRR